MKQKVLIKLSLSDKKKGRSKAMKIAVSVFGVESAALKGTNKDEIEVVGDMVDAAELTKSLRKNLGYAELVSVTPATGGDQKKTEEKNKEAAMAAVAWPTYTYSYGGVQPYYAYQVPNHEPSCSIM